MKIDRIMLVWDGNPFYEGFYEMHQRIWAKLGIETALVFVANGENEHLIPSTGDVRVLYDKSKVPFTPPPGRNWKATMAIIHGPRLFPGEVIRVCGMDQFPASRQFTDAVDKVPYDELATSIGDITHVPTGSIVAHHDVWTRIMNPAPMDFTELIEWTWERKPGANYGYAETSIGWGSDEVTFANLMQQCQGLKVRTLFRDCWTDWLDRTLGITQIAPDDQLLKEGYYTELHIRQPLSDCDKKTFERLVEIL